MKKYKSFLLYASYFLLSLLIYLIVITFFNHFEIVSFKVTSTISFIFIILLFMSIGFITGLKSERKGYLSGLIIGLVNISLILILSIILKSFPNFKNLIYFLVLLLSSSLGGMLGINLKH